MKHLKKFENFDLGRFPEEDNTGDDVTDIENTDCPTCPDYMDEYRDWEEEDEDEDFSRKWGDEEIVEKKNGVSYKKSGLKNPHKADLNKDKKISPYEKKRGKAIEDSIDKSGLTDKQKKLPKALQDAILAKKKNK
jgi:hypothetical protein